MQRLFLGLSTLLMVVLLCVNVSADVTGAGSTTNTQSTTGTSATNTAITGGYHSEATTNYQSGSSQNTTTTNTTNNNNTQKLKNRQHTKSNIQWRWILRIEIFRVRFQKMKFI